MQWTFGSAGSFGTYSVVGSAQRAEMLGFKISTKHTGFSSLDCLKIHVNYHRINHVCTLKSQGP